MRYHQTSNYDLLKQMLADLHDDLSLPWNSYPCLIWPRRLNQSGYGRVSINGVMLRVHRAAYEMKVGSIPAGYDLCHHCDNPPCFRPVHMFPGTRLDNIVDCKSKGRAAVGIRHWRARLTEADVREMRKLYSNGWNPPNIALKFKISHSNACYILRGDTWKHID